MSIDKKVTTTLESMHKHLFGLHYAHNYHTSEQPSEMINEQVRLHTSNDSSHDDNYMMFF